VVQPCSIENLALLTAGPAVSNPAELLMSPRLQELLGEVRAAYDVVIVDSSPLLSVTDPRLLGAAADGTVLVVRQGMTRRQDAEKAVEFLRALGTPFLGALVNGGRRLPVEDYGMVPGAASAAPAAPAKVVAAQTESTNG